MNNIFLVKSPLQLLNAIEAKHYFKLDDKECCLLIMGDRKSYSQTMRLVIDSQQWSNVVLLSRVGLLAGDPWSGCDGFDDIDQLRKTLLRSSFFSIQRLNRLARAIKDVQYIFVGDNNNPLMRHFVNSLDHQYTVLLDDGTATLGVARQRMEGKVTRKPNRISKRVRLALKRIFQRLNDRQPESVVFFTAYNVPVRDNDRVITNDFTYLRSRALCSKVTDTVYFLGSPLSEAGFMTEDSYLDYIKRVRKYYAERNILYISHRRESQEKLGKIKDNYGLDIACFEFPVEYQLALAGPRPVELASFISSAVDNCRLIFGDRMKIVAFRVNKINSDKRDIVNEIYKNYELSVGDDFIVETDF
ncbi:MAG: polysialyltransferase family glycosyltransferase [Thiohalophilus sp.]